MALGVGRLFTQSSVSGGIPALLQEGSGIAFVAMPRGEVSKTFKNTRLRTSPRVISLSLDHAALLKEGRKPSSPRHYVQSRVGLSLPFAYTLAGLLRITGGIALPESGGEP
jgi:hypothetical protein